MHLRQMSDLIELNELVGEQTALGIVVARRGEPLEPVLLGGPTQSPAPPTEEVSGVAPSPAVEGAPDLARPVALLKVLVAAAVHPLVGGHGEKDDLQGRIRELESLLHINKS